MAQRLNPPLTTPSSLQWDGNPQAPWRSVRSYFAVRQCRLCGKDMRPAMVNSTREGLVPEAETLFLKRECCGQSCAKKLKNPMTQAACRNKVSSTLRRIGHCPSVRGGNGSGPTKSEASLLAKLPVGEWVVGLAVPTLMGPPFGFPWHYKLDIANPIRKICIELDGGSHGSMVRQAQDKKKDAHLRALGWKVLRLSNTKSAELFSTCESVSTLRILRMAS